LDTPLMSQIAQKETLFRSLLKHPKIKQINGTGLMLAPVFESPEIANQVVLKCLDKGLILFWLLWEKKAVRISPPLTITEREIRKGCRILLDTLDSL
ncbi:MAG: aminotransferase class III-fold pyridoxal phosphate-dependent enzyme, partial [Flavobacteriaceae bacterium]